jgi:hypothetical protein
MSVSECCLLMMILIMILKMMLMLAFDCVVDFYDVIDSRYYDIVKRYKMYSK